jgi:hypothetical protein
MERLKNNRFSYKHYLIPNEESNFVETIRKKFHSIVVATTDSYASLSLPVKELLNDSIKKGLVKLLEVSNDYFMVRGRERDMLHNLREIELEIQSELGHGFIDDSFWSTVESLQVLKRLPESQISLGSNILRYALERASDHDINGSYDEVFGASCALLWLRATFLNVEDSLTRKTANWIKDNIDKYEQREQALALMQLLQSGFSAFNGTEAGDEKSLLRIINSINTSGRDSNLSEINALMYLQVANLLKDIPSVKKFVRYICHKQSETGLWVDISTTASAVVALLDARLIVADDISVVRIIDNSLFQAIISIQNARIKSAAKARPWDSKASTNLKCLEALLRFESLIELPVTEIVESLKTYANGSIGLTTLSGSLNVLTETQNELNDCKNTNKQLETELSRMEQKKHTFNRLKLLIWIESLIIPTIIYIFILFIMFNLSPIYSDFGKFLLDQIGMHIAYLALVAAVIAVPAISNKLRGENNDD